MRSWRSRGWPLSQPEAARPPPPSSLPSTAEWPGGTRAFPRWRERSRCTCAHETPPLGGTVRVSRPKPVSWQPLSRPKLIALRARQPPPCTPWLSCRFTKPRRSNRCTRVVPTQSWCRSCARRLTSLYERRKSQHGPSGRRCPPWWSRSAISGSTWQRWRTSTRHAFSTPRRHCRGLCPAVQQQTEAIQHTRRDTPSTAAPGARPQSARRRGCPPASSRAAPPQTESTPRPARRASRRRAAPPCVPARPQVIQEVEEAALMWATRRCWSLLFLRKWREQRRSFPWRRAGRRILCSVPPLVQGPVVPTSQERAISFSSGFSSPWDDSVRRPASSLSPTTHFCPQPKEYGSGTMYLPTHLWPVPFGTQGVRWGCLRTHCLLYHPSLLPFAAPLPVLRLCCWSRLHSVWRRGSHAQFDLATRFSSPGDLPSSTAFSRLRWQSGTPLSCVRRLLSSWQRMQSSRSLQPRWGRGFTALTSSYPRKVVNNQSWISESRTGLAQAPVQDADAQAHYQMHPPQDWFAAIDLKHAYIYVSILLWHRPFLRFAFEDGLRPPPRALPVSPCLYEGHRGRPYPASGSGRQYPQLPRRLAYLGPIQRAVVRLQGLGASAPQPVGASGQLGKEQALPYAENLFSRCGVRLCEYDGTPHGGTCPSSAELPEFLQRQECGTTETVSEAPGAYGIPSCSYAAQIASYETISALATLPCPDVGMAPRYTASGYHPAV